MIDITAEITFLKFVLTFIAGFILGSLSFWIWFDLLGRPQDNDLL